MSSLSFNGNPNQNNPHINNYPSHNAQSIAAAQRSQQMVSASSSPPPSSSSSSPLPLPLPIPPSLTIPLVSSLLSSVLNYRQVVFDMFDTIVLPYSSILSHPPSHRPSPLPNFSSLLHPKLYSRKSVLDFHWKKIEKESEMLSLAEIQKGKEEMKNHQITNGMKLNLFRERRGEREKEMQRDMGMEMDEDKDSSSPSSISPSLSSAFLWSDTTKLLWLRRRLIDSAAEFYFPEIKIRQKINKIPNENNIPPVTNTNINTNTSSSSFLTEMEIESLWRFCLLSFAPHFVISNNSAFSLGNPKFPSPSPSSSSPFSVSSPPSPPYISTYFPRLSKISSNGIAYPPDKFLPETEIIHHIRIVFPLQNVKIVLFLQQEKENSTISSSSSSSSSSASSSSRYYSVQRINCSLQSLFHSFSPPSFSTTPPSSSSSPSSPSFSSPSYSHFTPNYIHTISSHIHSMMFPKEKSHRISWETLMEFIIKIVVFTYRQTISISAPNQNNNNNNKKVINVPDDSSSSPSDSFIRCFKCEQKITFSDGNENSEEEEFSWTGTGKGNEEKSSNITDSWGNETLNGFREKRRRAARIVHHLNVDQTHHHHDPSFSSNDFQNDHSFSHLNSHSDDSESFRKKIKRSLLSSHDPFSLHLNRPLSSFLPSPSTSTLIPTPVNSDVNISLPKRYSPFGRSQHADCHTKRK